MFNPELKVRAGLLARNLAFVIGIGEKGNRDKKARINRMG